MKKRTDQKCLNEYSSLSDLIPRIEPEPGRFKIVTQAKLIKKNTKRLACELSSLSRHPGLAQSGSPDSKKAYEEFLPLAKKIGSDLKKLDGLILNTVGLLDRLLDCADELAEQIDEHFDEDYDELV